MWKNKLVCLTDLMDHLCVAVGRSQLLSRYLTCDILYRIYVNHLFSVLRTTGLDHGDFEGWITSISCIFLSCFATSSLTENGILRGC